MKNDLCPKCKIIADPSTLMPNQWIQEFEHGVWILSPNQYYPGYSELISKTHCREWHEVPAEIAQSLNENMRFIADKISKTCRPLTMNVASLGNVVEHLHWHIIPRYENDPQHLAPPDFTLPATLTPEMAKRLKEKFC